MIYDISTKDGRLKLTCWGWILTQQTEGLIPPLSKEKGELLLTRLVTLLELYAGENS